MKVLIFGAAGRLGRELVERLTKDNYDVLSLFHHDVDVRCLSDISDGINFHAPDVVINATARNGLEACQADPFQAFLVNVAAPAAMAAECKSIGALMIHFSTDYVFSGDELGLYEDAPTKPWGVYGRTKLWGEEGVALCGGAHFIFRLSSLYGREFAGVLEPIKQVFGGRGTWDNPVKVLHQFCAPTSTRLVADAVSHVLKTTRKEDWPNLSSLYHIAARDDAWKLEFTRYLLPAVFGHGVGSSWYIREGSLPEPRPVYSVLKTAKFVSTFNYALPTWREDLIQMLPLLPKVEAATTM